MLPEVLILHLAVLPPVIQLVIHHRIHHWVVVAPRSQGIQSTRVPIPWVVAGVVAVISNRANILLIKAEGEVVVWNFPQFNHCQIYPVPAPVWSTVLQIVQVFLGLAAGLQHFPAAVHVKPSYIQSLRAGLLYSAKFSSLVT